MKGIVVLVIVFFVVFTIAFVAMICYKGNKSIKKIHIVNKYIDNNPEPEENPKKNKKKEDKPLSKYVIKLKEEKDETICLYRCEKDIYDKLRIGRNYEIKVKSNEITEIIK